MAKFDEEEWRKRIEKEITAEELAAQAQRDASSDEAFMRDLSDYLGVPVAQIMKDVEQGIPEITQADVDQALKDIKAGKKAWKKGQKSKAAKLFKSPAVRKAVEASKKKNGCLKVIVPGLAGLGAMVYGLAEVAGAMLG